MVCMAPTSVPCAPFYDNGLQVVNLKRPIDEVRWAIPELELMHCVIITDFNIFSRCHTGD